MTDPGPVAARASLEVARAALGRMMSTGGSIAARTPSATMAARANDAWTAAEHVLHNVTGRVDLAGQPLLAEARRQDRIGLDDAHAIVALSDWVERTRAPGSAAQMLTLPPTEAERDVAAKALAALERAVGSYAGDSGSISSVDAVAQPVAGIAASDLTSIPPPFVAVPGEVAGAAAAEASRWAAPAASTPGAASRGNAGPNSNMGSSTASRGTPKSTSGSWSPAVAPSAGAPAGSPASPVNASSAYQSGNGSGIGSSRSSGLIMGVLLVVLLLAGGAGWYFLRERGAASSATDEGVAAYTRGALESARISLARAAQDNPNDARALTYLGRIAREQGDLAMARKYLESAIRVEPNNTLALRELGSALLADNQPELARRFYVRALTVNANDRASQGFLACALVRLQRTDEAKRWLDRAGPGDWTRCASPPPVPAPAR